MKIRGEKQWVMRKTTPPIKNFTGKKVGSNTIEVRKTSDNLIIDGFQKTESPVKRFSPESAGRMLKFNQPENRSIEDIIEDAVGYGRAAGPFLRIAVAAGLTGAAIGASLAFALGGSIAGGAAILGVSAAAAAPAAALWYIHQVEGQIC